MVEFKIMVKALHASGIEVILDVVFNHTAEGNEHGTGAVAASGIDNSVYYRLTPDDPRFYENLTGCGNTVNCEHPQVRSLIIECLQVLGRGNARRWISLRPRDRARSRRQAGSTSTRLLQAPARGASLAYVKLIAEPWDVGPGGYQLGRFPAGLVGVE